MEFVEPVSNQHITVVFSDRWWRVIKIKDSNYSINQAEF